MPKPGHCFLVPIAPSAPAPLPTMPAATSKSKPEAVSSALAFGINLTSKLTSGSFNQWFTSDLTSDLTWPTGSGSTSAAPASGLQDSSAPSLWALGTCTCVFVVHFVCCSLVVFLDKLFIHQLPQAISWHPLSISGHPLSISWQTPLDSWQTLFSIHWTSKTVKQSSIFKPTMCCYTFWGAMVFWMAAQAFSQRIWPSSVTIATHHCDAQHKRA